MKEKIENRAKAQAEIALMGFLVPVESEEQCKLIIGHILFTLSMGRTDTEIDSRAKKIYENAANKYNSDKNSVSYVTVNATDYGTLVTFVRDNEAVVDGEMKFNSREQETDALCWVENLEYPDSCSELGYCYFRKLGNGFIRRIA